VESVCHRCGTALHASEIFCPHCGAPQLCYEPSDVEAPAYSATRASLPPGALESVQWRDAILAALTIALPVGLLASLLDFSSVWGISGGIAAISLYRRRTGFPAAGRAGWRIGSLLGLLAAFVSTAADGITLLFQRYVLHNGGVIDHRFGLLAGQLTEQMNRSNPEAATVMPWFLHFWRTPEGIAALVLMGAIGSALSMVLFSAAGGVIGARITTFGSRPQRSS
jgi:hypothetical protein